MQHNVAPRVRAQTAIEEMFAVEIGHFASAIGHEFFSYFKLFALTAAMNFVVEQQLWRLREERKDQRHR